MEAFEQLVFVVIDGLDASGKSTQALKLYTFLRNKGKTVYLRFHPSNDNFFGVEAKQFLYLRGKSAHSYPAQDLHKRRNERDRRL